MRRGQRRAALVGRLEYRGGIERASHDGIEALPAALGQPLVARRAPYPGEPGQHLAGVAKAERGQTRAERLGRRIVLERARPDLGSAALVVHSLAMPACLVGENLIELRLDELAMRLELRAKRRVVGEAQRFGKPRTLVLVDRDGVRLRILPVLQPVLDRAQETVRLREPRANRRREQSARGRMLEYGERRAYAETGVLATPDQLKHLRAELDLADAAAPELDVVGFVRPHRRTPPGLFADLTMQRADGAYHAEVEIAPVDERFDERIELRGETLGRLALAPRYEAPLDPGVALPLAPLHVEVLFEHAKAAHERTRIAVRPQAHIHAKYVAVGRLLREGADQAAPQPREEFLRRDRRPRTARRLAFVLVDEDEIDVGRNVQFAATELAHAEHAKRELLPLGAARLAVKRFQIGRERSQRVLDRGLREVGHRPHDLVEIAGAGKVALHDRAEHLRAQAAQRPAQCRLGQRRVLVQPAGQALFGRQRRKARVDALPGHGRLGPGRDERGQFRPRRHRARGIGGISGTRQCGSSHGSGWCARGASRCRS